MQFACANIVTISSVVNNLDVHKDVGADGLSSQFLGLLLT